MNPGDIGFIFHVGLYNFYAFDDIKNVHKRKIMNGSEWYYGRLIAGNYMPPASHKETKQHHEENGYGDYFDAQLNIGRDSIEHWIDVCSLFGAKYVIITTRHHDGYCLWNTNTTKKKSIVDIIQIFTNEAKHRGIKVGFYYSWMEFGTPMTVDYFNSVCIPQVTELLEYEPDMFWFDGDWDIKQKSIYKTMDIFLQILTDRGISFNDRLGKIKKENRPWTIEPSYRVFEDRHIPSGYTQNWQHINTIGVSWGYNKQQRGEHYKCGTELLELYNTITKKGGSLLLNIATDHNGAIDEYEDESLYQFYSSLE